MNELPLPPISLRQLVGPTEDAMFDNPTGARIFPELPPEVFESVLDFGCGCGRVARQLIQQNPRPSQYIGVDIHSGMISWCRTHLAPHALGFRFEHHNVRAPGLNPAGEASVLPFPTEDDSATLAIAWSVFTHLNQEQTVHYLAEIARTLRPGGVLMATFFLFDKKEFPMMQEFQNSLFINEIDPTNAVIFDRQWLPAVAAAQGLTLTEANPPTLRGFQWKLFFTAGRPDLVNIELPQDEAPIGVSRPPLMPPEAEKLGHS